MAATTFVVLPKYTSLAGTAGGTAYVTDAFDVSNYSQVDVTVLLLAVTSSGTVSAQIEESADGNTWSGVGMATTLTGGTVATLSKSNPANFIRLKATVTTANAVGTLWAYAVARTP